MSFTNNTKSNKTPSNQNSQSQHKTKNKTQQYSTKTHSPEDSTFGKIDNDKLRDLDASHSQKDKSSNPILNVKDISDRPDGFSAEKIDEIDATNKFNSILGKGAKDKPRDVDGTYYHKNLNQPDTDSILDSAKLAFEHIKEETKKSLGLSVEIRSKDTLGSYFAKNSNVRISLNNSKLEEILKESGLINVNTNQYSIDHHQGVNSEKDSPNLLRKAESVLGIGAEDKPRDIDGSYYHKDFHADTSADAFANKSLLAEIKEAVEETIKEVRKDSQFINEKVENAGDLGNKFQKNEVDGADGPISKKPKTP